MTKRTRTTKPLPPKKARQETETLTNAERIWQVVHAIPAGKVCTYGEVARRAGLPGYARYVGTTLSKLPDGSTLPWYRVLNSQGKISFAEGSDAYCAQIRHLQSEGVEVCNGKVNLGVCLWQP